MLPEHWADCSAAVISRAADLWAEWAARFWARSWGRAAEKRGAVEQGVGKASGLDAAKVGKLLMILAPIVMSALAKRKQQAGLDAEGLARELEQEQHQMERNTPGMAKGGLMDLLDRDGDGSIAGEIGSIGAALGGSGLLGGLLGGR